MSLAQDGFASILSHHHMLRDTVRVLAYQSAIARHSRGCSVVEVGCGTGILSIFAARAGARRVVAIEESEIAIVAQRMFRANGCDEIELRRTNSRDVELDEPADLLIHEILGVDPFAENLLPAVLDARERLLRPGGRLLPSRVQVLCLGLEVEPRPHRDMDYILAEAAEIQRLYGVDLGPVLDLLAETDPRQLVPPLEDGDPDDLQAEGPLGGVPAGRPRPANRQPRSGRRAGRGPPAHPERWHPGGPGRLFPRVPRRGHPAHQRALRTADELGAPPPPCVPPRPGGARR